MSSLRAGRSTRMAIQALFRRRQAASPEETPGALGITANALRVAAHVSAAFGALTRGVDPRP